MIFMGHTENTTSYNRELNYELFLSQIDKQTEQDGNSVPAAIYVQADRGYIKCKEACELILPFHLCGHRQPKSSHNGH